MMAAIKQAEALLPLWTATSICAAIGGQTTGGDPAIFGLAIDSREVRDGDAFFAMPGTGLDGHDYVEMALSKGAVLAIVRHDWAALQGVDEAKLIRCADPKQALINMAIARRAEVSATIIGVTGSVAKTSLKDAIHRCVGREALAHTNVRSFNNDVGVPLTMARMPLETQFGIFEMGMNHAGELTALSGWVRPDVALITTVALAHSAFFDSEADIADAKAEIFIGLEPGGTAILPRDNRHFERLLAAAKAAGASKIITFGNTAEADVHPITVARHGHCTTLTAKVVDQTMLFKVGIPGAHWVTNALACIAAVYCAGADLGLAGLSLADMRALPGRGAMSAVAVGAGEAVLMDDSYNANPASMTAALETFGTVEIDKRGRRIAVLADMLELGDDSPQLHADLVKPLVSGDVDTVICVGPLMAHLAKAAQSHVSVIEAQDDVEALKRLKSILRSGDALLVKGSNSMKLGRLVTALKNGALALSDRRPGMAGEAS